MLPQLKLKVSQVFASPKVRAVLILTTLVIAALVGGAPEDFGGG
jgi:hypothetical protein